MIGNTKEKESIRHIFINNGEQLSKFKGNAVATTKYNLVTFFPKALAEQFRCTDHPSYMGSYQQ